MSVTSILFALAFYLATAVLVFGLLQPSTSPWPWSWHVTCATSPSRSGCRCS
jgi:hypothetical protein